MAKAGKRVLLIDADPQGSLTVSLGIKRQDELEETLATVLRDVAEDREPSRSVIQTAEGVDFVPANIELSAFEVSLFNTMSREFVLKRYIESVKQNYEYVLIDCMPSLSMLTVNALAAADSVIIPSQPNFLSTKGLDLLFKSIARVKRQINPKLKIDGILFTMVDSRTNNAKSIIGALRKTVGENIRVFDTQIPFSVKAAESTVSGKSIFAHDKNGKVAAAYENFVKEVLTLEQRERARSWSDGVR